MLFNDLVTDVNYGDVNIHDVFATEATEQVNVASTYFEYALKLAEAEEASDRVVQEAATEEGLPTKAASGAAELATDSVTKQLAGFYGVVVSNAKKVKAATDRDMAIIIGLGKKNGLSASSAGADFAGTFAKPLAQALVKQYGGGKVGKSISFVKGVFPSARKAHDLMLAYGNSIARLAIVYGIKLTDAANDPTVKKQLSINGVTGEPATDISGLYKKIMKGTMFAKTDFGGDTGASSSASVSELADVITYLYVVNQISGAVAGGSTNGKNVEAYLSKLCKEAGDMKKLAAINDKAKGWCASVNASASTIVKVFSDAAAALGNIATGNTKGVTEYCVESYELDPHDDVFVYAEQATEDEETQQTTETTQETETADLDD